MCTCMCSAGVGRTGTFIALDTLFRHIEHAAQQQQQQVQQPTIDVFGIVYRMRMNRIMMVQTEVLHKYLLSGFIRWRDFSTFVKGLHI